MSTVNRPMTMQSEPGQRIKFVRSILPWLIGVAALVIYLPTLNTGVSLNNIAQVGKISGWTWSSEFYNPVYYVCTYPLRWMPPSWTPLGLNLFSLVCAVLTLVLLARSVVLLPHDRTEAQRQRERSRHGLL